MLFSNGYSEILIALIGLPVCGSHGAQPLRIQSHHGKVTFGRSVGDEQKLIDMLAAVDRLFDHCADTVRHTDVSVWRWLRSAFPDRPYKLSFELLTTARSDKIYRMEMKRHLCFWLRLSRLPYPNMAIITGRTINKYQALALEEIWSDAIWGSKATIEIVNVYMERTATIAKRIDITVTMIMMKVDDKCGSWETEETAGTANNGFQAFRNSETRSK